MTQATDAAVHMVRIPPTLVDFANLAGLLERIDRGNVAPEPAQYRRLVERIIDELRRRAMDPSLKDVIACFPSAAQLYENLNYEVAGLCMSPLERSVETEQAARRVLQSLVTRRSSLKDE